MNANSYRNWLIAAVFGAVLGAVLGLGTALPMTGGRSYDAFQDEAYYGPHANEPPPGNYRIVLPEDRLLPGWAWWTLAGSVGGFVLFAWQCRPLWLMNLNTYRVYRQDWRDWEQERKAACRRLEQIKDPFRQGVEAEAEGRRLARIRPDRRWIP